MSKSAAERLAGRIRGGKRSAAIAMGTEADRLNVLRHTDAYKKWLEGWQGQMASMNNRYLGVAKKKG